MNPQFLNIIRKQVEKALGKTNQEVLSSYQTAKKNYQVRKSSLHILRDAAFIIMGVLSAGFGLKGFLIPNGFIDGGITGISLLVHIETKVPLAVLIILFNVPFI